MSFCEFWEVLATFCELLRVLVRFFVCFSKFSFVFMMFYTCLLIFCEL